MWPVITKAWWHLPLSRPQKEVVKTIIFISFPFIFRNTSVYRNWYEVRLWKGKGRRHYSLDQEKMFKINPLPVLERIYQPESIPAEPITSIAVIIHAFHFDIFLEIMEYFKQNTSASFRFYVTYPPELSDPITNFFKQTSYRFKLLEVENRGRDILPFLKIIPFALDDGLQIIVKIHTKKSDHRLSGNLWRKDLYSKLLKEPAVKQALKIFNTDHTAGLIGAPGHLVPMNLYYGSNAKMIGSLSEAMGIVPSQLASLNFSAGSMFYARSQALMPLLSLDLKRDHFEEEQGQKDGTLAHAVERAFAISTFAANMKLVDTSYNRQKEEVTVTKDHPFTN